MTMTPQRFMALGFLAVALVFSSQTLSSKALWAAEESLYERLGGTYPIAVVVDDFMNRINENGTVNANPISAAARTTVPLSGLKFRVIAFMVQAAGGPKVYAGRAMKEFHPRMKITAREWDAMLADLRASLYRYNVPDRELKEVIDLVNSIKGDIVTASN
jgi:hemoglobin